MSPRPPGPVQREQSQRETGPQAPAVPGPEPGPEPDPSSISAPIPAAVEDHPMALGAPEPPTPLWRRLAAEAFGTGALAVAVVGSGISADRGSDDAAVSLLAHSTTVALALGALIVLLQPISGAHFNPVVTLIDRWFSARAGVPAVRGQVVGYVAAQVLGGCAGVLLADVMYALPAVQLSQTQRATPQTMLGEVVGTIGLVVVCFVPVRPRHPVPGAVWVPAYIWAAIWCTSSYCFINPALTLARSLTDTMTGIAPSSVPWYVLAQIVGAVLGVPLVRLFWPHR